MPLPTELTLLGWSVALLLVHIALQGQLGTASRGARWGAGARDGDPAPLGIHAARAERALRNFNETYPAFVALALALAVTGRTGGAGEVGAIAWFAARVVHLPLYIFGVPYLRSVAWLVSALGLVAMLVRLL